MLTFLVAFLERKKLLIHLYTPAYTEGVTKGCSGKKVFLLSRFNVKTSVKGSYFSKVAAFYPAVFATMNTVTGIFKDFPYL